MTMSGVKRQQDARLDPFSDVNSLSDNDQKLFKQALPGDMVVGTEETIFHVQGGGQPSDTGSMILDPEGDGQRPLFEVVSVRRAGDGAIHHHGRIVGGKNSVPEASLKHGMTVQQNIDAEKREFYSRLHTAGHLLSVAVRQHASTIPGFDEGKGQHFPDAAFVEFQGKIGNELIAPIQETLDELVAQDLAVRVSWLSEAEMPARQIVVPEGFPYFSAEGTRVVEIKGKGGYPCSGTHVSSTAKLGKVVVSRISYRKRISKVYYEVKNVS